MMPFSPVLASSLQGRGLQPSTGPPGSHTGCRIHSTANRELQVLECAANVAVPHSLDPRVTAFHSLTALCGENPGGMGYICNQNGGAPVPIDPPTALYRGPPDPQVFRNACLDHCWCEDLGPGLPMEIQTQRPQQCGTSVASSGDEAVDQPAAACDYRDPNTEDNIYCSEFYGSPSQQACSTAQDLLDSDEHEPVTDPREFLSQSVNPVFSGSTLERTPQHYPPDAQLGGNICSHSQASC